MKAPRSFLPVVGLLAACLGSFSTLGLHPAQAGGSGTGLGSSGVSSDGHGGSGAGSAHVSSPMIGTASASSHVGLSSGYHATGLISTAAGYHGSPRYVPGAFTPNVFPNGPSASRATRFAASRAARPGFPTVPFGTQPDNGTARANAQITAQAQIHNAWTDPTSPAMPNLPGGRVTSSSHTVVQTANSRRKGSAFSGTILFPDAPRDVLGISGFNNASAARYNGHPSTFFQGRRRYYSDFGYPYPLCFYGGFPSYADSDVEGVGTSDYNNLAANGGIGDPNALSPDAVNNLSQPYATSGTTFVPVPADNTAAPPVNPPPQTSTSADLRSNAGPDSLVEAVQAELSRRGYFGGKIDAVYDDATHKALQRFQTDQQLSATGRINEATLHALQLD